MTKTRGAASKKKEFSIKYNLRGNIFMNLLNIKLFTNPLFFNYRRNTLSTNILSARANRIRNTTQFYGSTTDIGTAGTTIDDPPPAKKKRGSPPSLSLNQWL